MTKVVYNACYGGFSLSTDAVREYLRRTGREWTEEEHCGLTTFTVNGEENWYDRDIPRTDPVLVAIVEEWGDRANGTYAKLAIEDISPGTAYRIDEDGGYEAIEVRDSVDWSVA